MKLTHLETKNVLGAPDGAYTFAGDDGEVCNVTAIVGGAGAGKSSLLEAVTVAKETIGAYGHAPTVSRVLRHGQRAGRVATTWLLSENERQVLAEQRSATAQPVAPVEGDSPAPENSNATATGTADAKSAAVDAVLRVSRDFDIDAPPKRPDRALQDLFSRYSRSPKQAKMEYFPANRQILPELWKEPTGPLRDRQEAGPRLTRSPLKYGFVRQLFFNVVVAEGMRLQQLLAAEGMVLPSEELDLLAPYKEAVALLAPDLCLVRVEALETGSADVWFAHRDGREMELSSLSASEAQAVLFATTFIRQGLRESLILIDVPELHVHRSQQAAFLRGLVSLGHGSQFIVATNTPEIVSEIEGARTIELGSRTPS